MARIPSSPSDSAEGGDRSASEKAPSVQAPSSAPVTAVQAAVISDGKATATALAAEPQVDVYVPFPPGKRGDYVCLARINGVAYWGVRGQKKSVPADVARIAWEAGVTTTPPPDYVDRRVLVGQQPPELSGAPAGS